MPIPRNQDGTMDKRSKEYKEYAKKQSKAVKKGLKKAKKK